MKRCHLVVSVNIIFLHLLKVCKLQIINWMNYILHLQTLYFISTNQLLYFYIPERGCDIVSIRAIGDSQHGNGMFSPWECNVPNVGINSENKVRLFLLVDVW